MISVENQSKFYSWQLKEIAIEWKSYYESKISYLIQVNDCFLGELHGFDDVRGQLIVKFKRSEAPRLELLYSFYSFSELDYKFLTYKEFSQKAQGIEDNLVSALYHLDQQSDFSYVALGNIPMDYYAKLKASRCLDPEEKRNGIKPLYILVGKPEPPIKYLLRLRHFTDINSKSGYLKIAKAINQDLQLLSGSTKVDELINYLQNEDIVIIQGPPGTGKSSVVAEYIKRVIKGSKICVTALANKALIEIAEKLEDDNTKGNLFKSNLTVSEKKDYPYLQIAPELNINASSVLLTTYYKLSELITSLTDYNPIYDYLIIEEASQAYYTTLQAFRWLAKKVIIIGDPNQLLPIVLNERKAYKIDSHVHTLINGLETLIKTSTGFSFFMDETFRLNSFNTKLTNVFYSGYLKSKNDRSLEIEVSNSFVDYFKEGSNTQIWLRNSLKDQSDLRSWSLEFLKLLQELELHQQKLEIAILSVLKEDVRFLQDELGLYIKSSKHKIVLETVDRVQGLTVDITFFIVNLNANPSFILNSNRFNVATSRARHYNVIVIDKGYEIFVHNVSKEVKYYFQLLNQ